VKSSVKQALGIAGAGALSTKVAGKMVQSLATKGSEKLNNMRNTLRTSAVANVTKQAYQSVKNAPASWTQSLHKTYNNILDSSMPSLGPELAPAGPALAQQTVRETLQNVKQQTMQMVTKVKYDPVHNRYRGAGGRFMSKRHVEKLGDSVKVETVRRVDKPVKVERVSEREFQKGTANKIANVAEGIIRDGSHMTTEGALKPNVKYKTGEYEYLYETDNAGRLKEFDAGDLRLTERDSRLPHKSNTPGKETGDHAGHLAGDRFGGSPDLDNLVSQSSDVNLSKYKKLENKWAKAIEKGKHVSVNVKINYEGNNVRPSSFDIEYEIQGRMSFTSIEN